MHINKQERTAESIFLASCQSLEFRYAHFLMLLSQQWKQQQLLKQTTFTSVSDTPILICTKSTKITPQIKPWTVWYCFLALHTDAPRYIRVEEYFSVCRLF